MVNTESERGKSNPDGLENTKIGPKGWYKTLNFVSSRGNKLRKENRSNQFSSRVSREKTNQRIIITPLENPFHD